MMKFTCHLEMDGVRFGEVSGRDGSTLKTPLLSHPVDLSWQLTTLELADLGVQCLKTNYMHARLTALPTLAPGWSGPVVMTSGIVEAELAGISMKWTPDHVDIKIPETGAWETFTPSEGGETAWISAVMQPPVLVTTSQTRRKSVLLVAAAWQRAPEEGRVPECCIQGDPALLEKLIKQQDSPPGSVLWQAGADRQLRPTALRWHAGIVDWKDFLIRLYEGADILTVDFLHRYNQEGLILTAEAWQDITLPDSEFSQEPFASDCECQSCQDFTRSYLHHLWSNTPLLAQRILAIHNVFYLERMIDSLRNALETGKFLSFTKQYPVVKRKSI